MIPGFGFDEGFVHPPMPEGFLEDMERLRGRTAPESEYVPSPGMRHGFRDLSERELGYYLWWRSRVSAGEAPETDEGYVWLRLAELVNDDIDPPAALSEILRIVELYPNERLGIVSARDAAAEYAMVFGLPLDSRMYSPFSEYASGVLHGVLMRYPTGDLEAGTLLSVTHNDTKYVDDPGKVAGLVSLAVRCMDEYDRSRYGAGLARCHGEQFSMRVADVFRGLPYRGERQLVRPGPENRGGDSLTEFLSGAWRAVAKALWRSGNPKGGPTVPKGFGKEYRSIADAVVADFLAGRDTDPASHRYTGPGCHRGPFSDDVPEISEDRSAAEVVGGSQAEVRDDEEDVSWLDGADPSRAAAFGRPVVIRDPEAIVLRFGRDTMDDILRYRGLESEVDAPYVPSGATVMTWSAMDRHQRAYYIRWRTLASRGVYGFTDQGYMGLYLSELVNSEMDPDRVVSELEGIRDAFLFTEETSAALDDALESYGILTGARAPDLREGDPEFNRAAITRKLMSSPVSDLSMLEACFIGGDMYDRNGLTEEQEAMCGRGVTFLLRRLDAGLSGDGKRVSDLFVDSGDTYRVRLFRTVFFNGPHEAELPVLDFGRSYDGRRIVRAAVRHVMGAAGLSERGAPHVQPWMTELFESAAAEWAEGERRRARREEAERVVLDGSAVESAEMDLGAVTGMMTVDDVEPEAEAPEPAAPPDREPSSLGEALDAAQREYLRASLDGPFAADAVLRRHGMLMSVMEDSINDLAMTFVGDSVVEGGQAVPEYIDEIRDALERDVTG